MFMLHSPMLLTMAHINVHLSLSVDICQYLSISVIFPYLASHPLPNLQMKTALAASLCASGSATGYHHHLIIMK